ncbi:MAG: YfiR family protein [Methylobacter sp.]
MSSNRPTVFILLCLAIDLSANFQSEIRLASVMRRSLILFALALSSVWNTSVAEEQPERESQITVAYLYHFTKFTEWPTVSAVFHYCVYDNVNFTNLLQQTYSGRTIGDASIDVKNINSQSKLEDCQLIYFPEPGPADFLKKVSQYPILSVGSQKDFTELGGVIYLFEEDQKIRFYVNNAAATNAGLKISSQLLRLSKEP